MKFILFSTCILFSTLSIASIDILKLHAELQNMHTMPLEYKESKKLLFSTVDNNQGIVCSAYTPLECRTQNKNRSFNLNIEHTWPQSKGAKYFPAQGDMHHLYVTSKESNSIRANYPFCVVFESEWSKQGSMCGFDENFNECFEPVDSHKGNVARAMFYFSIRYKKSLPKEKEELFRGWNSLDPVDSNERLRNDKIEKLQGNRNPFIDNELLIDNISRFEFPKKH